MNGSVRFPVLKLEIKKGKRRIKLVIVRILNDDFKKFKRMEVKSDI